MEELPGTLLFRGVVGSHAYGLAHNGSDIDIIGAYVAPSETFWGFDKPESSFVSHNPDMTFHEIGKYLHLLCKNNPTILETLYLDEYEFTSEIFDKIRWIRSQFLSKQVYFSYGGYARQQTQRLKNRSGHWAVDKRYAKHARHTVRLLIQGTEILRTGHLTVDVGQMRDYLLSLGDLSPDEMLPALNHFTEDLEEAYQDSQLPEHPDIPFINSMLIDIRRELYVPLS